VSRAFEIDFTNAFYIKLGAGGVWEPDSIQTGKMRIGWLEESLADINSRNWTTIERQLRASAASQNLPAQVATKDLNNLMWIVESTSRDVWVTFHKAKLWWTRLLALPVEGDDVSKFRRTEPWTDRAMDGRLLVASELPGKLAALQGFRGTVCHVHAVDLLGRVITGSPSPLAAAIDGGRESLCQNLVAVIKDLHWKDFETLVDLVFRAAGWERVSVLGQHAKAYDLELREPIANDRYVVQVKSRASLGDLRSTVSEFSGSDFRRVFFVVHSPERNIVTATGLPDHVEVVTPGRLAALALDAGLVGWLRDKAF
jgi:hypothetical protein